MGSRQVSIHKISPPELPNVVLRKDLFRLLDHRGHYRITWISSLAGSGKTTLVASYLTFYQYPCLWYHMDEGDSDIASFFYYLGMAAKRATPRKRKPLPLLTPEYRAGVGVFARRFFENLCLRLSPPFTIVFDNYQTIPQSVPFHDVFKAALAGVSPEIHVIVLSRTDPPGTFSGMLANNDMRIIGTNDLLLSLEESTEVVRIGIGRELPAQTVKRIHKKTQGWAAGLILLAKSAGAGDNLSGIARDFVPETVFDYFANELFSKLDASQQEFLLKTAFLPNITVSLARDLTGRADAGRLLSSLRQHHLFTGRLSTPAASYQYHPLFRAFLIATAEKSFDTDKLAMLQQRAAGLLQEAGQMEGAVDLFSRCGDNGHLIQLILEYAGELLAQGRHNTLEQWIRKLPSDVVEQQPWLQYWLAVSCLHVSATEARNCFEKAFNGFVDRRDTVGQHLAWSGIVESIAYEWNDFNLLDPWIDWFDKHASRQPVFPSLELETRVCISRVAALILRRPNHPDLLSEIERALSLSRTTGNIALYIQALYWSITYHAWTGNFAKISSIRSENRKLEQSLKTAPARRIHWRWIDMSTRICNMDQIDSIPDELTRTLGMVRETGLQGWEHVFLMPGIFVALLNGNLSGAATFLERFKSILDISHYHTYSVFHYFTSLYLLHKGELVQALAHAETASVIADETGYVFPTMVCRLQLAYLLHETGATQRGNQELARTHELSIQTKSRILEFMCLMLGAKAALDQGQEEKGLQLLQKAMLLGRRQNYLTMAWWWHPPAIVRLCMKALIEGIEVDYVKRLIRINRLVPDVPPLHIENWPWTLKIYTLGGFRLVKNDKPVRFSGKVQKRPLELLKVVIAYGGINVHTDRVIDALWQESDGDMAQSAFSTTLNRLRKLLGTKDAIQLRGGKISLNQYCCQVDTWVFERLCARAQSLYSRGAGPKAVFEYARAIDCYAGHFLADEGLKPWMAPLRERLKEKLLNAILAIGDLLERENAFDDAMAYYQRGLSVDELEEALYRRMMSCCLHLGRKAQAIKLYRRCRIALHRGLGIGPSDETETIYRSVVNKR